MTLDERHRQQRVGQRTRHSRRPTVEHAAWVFYAVAAIGSTIGQIWVGVQTPPWPDTLHWWWRATFVAPFAIVIDLGGAVTAAFADWRQRLGESAYGWRILSAATVTVGVTTNIVGHADVAYLAVVFGGLGVFAYAIWLMHSAARRRDALRAAGKLADTAPAFGIGQWWREPAVTRRARSLAVAQRLPLHQSLDIARQQLRDEKRRAALASHVETLIRSRHDDPVRADIAATTLDLDAVAATLTAQADVPGWARVIGADLTPPTPNSDVDADAERNPAALPVGPMPPADVLRRVPQDQASYDRWRQLWAELKANPDLERAEFAQRHNISLRQVQRISRIGASGLLDSPLTLIDRVAQLGGNNGHARQHPASAS
ncbi:hypothetical protein [Plantactinospora sp. CA-290183]|uniref:hypothetical protein n=1 Tax=Plantactinospora sp. CA-290183 TaxID=3240006 RepID=UPI003D9210BC